MEEQLDPDKFKEAWDYISNIFKILNGDEISSGGNLKVIQGSQNQQKNIHNLGPLDDLEKSANFHVSTDFHQLIVSNGDKKVSQCFSYKDFKLEKHGEYDMFYLQSIIMNLKRYGIVSKQVENFIHSYGFYNQLCLLDSTLQRYGNVYLMINHEENKCKVGMSYDITKRYPKEKRENELVYVVPVKNMNTTETKLINHFRKKYGEPVNGHETFRCTNIRETKKEFMKVVRSYEVHIDISKSSSQHITSFKSSLMRRGLWVSFGVASIIFNHFISDENDRKDVMKFMSLIKYMIDEDEYIYTTYNQKLKTDVEFILFHKYRIMRNEKDLYVNASALYNSIKKHGGCKVPYRDIKTMLLSPRFQFRIKQLKIARPKDVPYYFHENLEQKYLEGYYIHYALVHFLIDLIDAKYAIETSILIFDIYSGNVKLTTSKEKKKTIDIKQLYPNMKNEIELPALHGGNNVHDRYSFIFSSILISLILISLIILISSYSSYETSSNEKPSMKPS